MTPSSPCSAYGGRSSSACTSRSPLSASQARRQRPVVVVGADRRRVLQAHRAGVERLDEADDRDAGLLVAGHDRALDRGGAAPARQQRRVDVEDLVVAEQRVADQRAVGAHGAAPRARAAAIRSQHLLVVQALGLDQLDAELARLLGDRRRRELAPAALGRVGAGDDELRAVVRAGQPLEHGGGELRRAEVDDPQGGSYAPTPSGGDAGARLAQGPHRLLALVARRAVEDQDAVEVVHLVLEHARLEPGRLDEQLVAVLVGRLDADVHRALDLDEHAGQRQAALLGGLALLAGPLQDGVDDRGHRRVRVDAVDEQPVHDADLRGGEPDPQRVVHDLAHPADLLGERVVEALDVQRAAAQHRVAVLADQLQGRVAAGAGLRIELVAELLGFLCAARGDGILVGHTAREFREARHPPRGVAARPPTAGPRRR